MNETTSDLQRIFLDACEHESPAEQARYLDLACGGDAALRRQVEALLRASPLVGDFLRTPLVSIIAAGNLATGESPGTVIGPYKLLEKIGEGGMGSVYMAEQAVPVRRRVALKLVRAGMDTKQVFARFEAERQALALMDHPNIAKVLDAGATDTGRPYFVMELVKGTPITEYCDQAQLTPRQRLRLLVPVCRAIEHAHQKRIIHRDIKPSNVLVASYDGEPVPKVIDFGVAKALEQPLTDQTLFTQHGAVVGTFDYMSPEQAENSALDVDTRSDVYSLGVLLYELMTGTTPLERHRLRESPLGEILRRIREEDPPSLGNRLSRSETLPAIAAQRGMEPSQLMRLLHGELDWIAMKALEKDRSRRYQTPGDLARDLERYLADEPVEAIPPSASYRLRKLARRHRVAVAASTVVIAVLLVATAFSTWQAIRATREGAKSRRAEAEARAVLEFFRDRVMAAARPKDLEGGLGREVSLRAALDAAEPSIAADFAAQPGVEAAIRHTLGTSYVYLGDATPAIRQLERARDLRIEILGRDHPDTLAAANDLGVALKAAGRTDDAIALLKDTLSRRRAVLGSDHRDTQTTLNNLAVAYQAANRVAEAIPLHEEELRQTTARLGSDDRETLISENNLASAYLVVGRVAEALPLLEDVLERRGRLLPEGDLDTLTSMNNLAAAYQLAGRPRDAIPIFGEVLERRKGTLGPEHPDTLKAENNLALANQEAGLIDVALPMLEEVLRLRRTNPGIEHPDTLTSMNNLAAACLETKRWPEAEALLRDCLRLREKLHPDDWRRFHTMSQLGAALAARGIYAEAEPLLVGGYEGMQSREAGIPPHRRKDLTAAAWRIVPYYEAWGKPDQAAAWRARLAGAQRQGS